MSILQLLYSRLYSLHQVVEDLGLSYKNSAELNAIIDKHIPSRRLEFIQEEIIIAGEAFELYRRDIIECIRALYGDPQHASYLCFVPERHYADADQTIRLYHDFHTGRWWWETQQKIEEKNPGATIIPIIISSDKTQVTLFRNKTAYPVYMTIGNLPKDVRRKPSLQGQILLAYLPTTRLSHVKNQAQRRRILANLFHAGMRRVLDKLKEDGVTGIPMQSGDGVWRRCHPIFATYVGDYPEQILITCSYYGDCPICHCPNSELGSFPCDHGPRDFAAAERAAKLLGTPAWADACADANLKPVQHPFWVDLPYVDIFLCITPDMLHQMYQGVMKHLIGWLTDICGADELDARVRRLPKSHGIRVFQKGITSLSRVSGAEHKQICTFLLGIIIDIQLPDNVSNTPLLRAT
jgi:hypothetical protein